MLGAWQQEYIKASKEHYSQNNKHFLCLATPGAGKTVFIGSRIYIVP